ncbi:IS607 family transposase [Ktedonobacter sp. SOSP1-85]|uniref:IS607 family transposase n=1 Tax=Ktedonobacter sp. SOSP1-85 TaxID=2778367 RepID=UPI001915904D|nr:IS607 family transposase [Ktedonobacter sp. SOSP1-85]GHO77283.1 IS607 family transposase [Ktedonobacter sp. SOSP1-85]
MKLIDYAKQQGISYRTAWRWYKAGKIAGHQMDTGTILVTEPVPVKERPALANVVVYTRVSSAENTSNLDSQAERLVAYCTARGYQVSKVVKEIGSGVNDNRPKFLALLADPSIGRIVIEHKDRGTRFGFRYIETLLKTYGREIEVVNQAESGTEDLLADLTSIIYSFCARLYGQRRAKRKTEKIVQELEQGSYEEAQEAPQEG